MKKKYDIAVYIGRFQPFHNGHKSVVEYAAKYADKVLILLGSANNPRTPKNPFSSYERSKMIIDVFENTFYQKQLRFDVVADSVYDEAEWISYVESAVETLVKNSDIPFPSTAIVGHSKDESSYYINSFPQWDVIEAPAYTESNMLINSTDIRRMLFEYGPSFVKGVVPSEMYPSIEKFVASPVFAQLKEDYTYIAEYKRRWENAPYAPTFVTADAVVIQSGHILLVQRGCSPGKGLWALPGGFINADEKIADAAIRELREETGLKVPEKVLRGSIKFVKVFDKPDRSSRGRTITHAYGFHLDDASPLPKVKGSDDAVDAKWVSIGEFMRMENVMFEDHYFIVKSVINQI